MRASCQGEVDVAAAAIIAAIGTDMSRFASDKHLARLSGSVSRQQEEWRKTAGWAEYPWQYLPSRRFRGGGFCDCPFERPLPGSSLPSHRSPPRETESHSGGCATSVLVIMYHLFCTKKPYADLGADYFDTLDTTCVQRDHVRRLEHLGYEVTLIPKEKDVA
ncbi:MAG TPA: hypothetical protein VFN35_16160 [Ktedonobacteraceae bacterium]|nr:hypothetical protein [Ktedonobacteraceae bacterium]